jgi:HlyD family secretion protein
MMAFKLDKKGKIIIFLTFISALLLFFFLKKEDDVSYIIYKITRGNLVKEINANGTINPVNVITVGAQVTALVKNIYVNYNDEVIKDQVLAQLDTSLLLRQVEIDKGNMNKVKAAVDYNYLNWQRNKKLFDSGYIAKIDLDQAYRDYKSSKAEFDSYAAQYEKSFRNLKLATIKSPVAGVVISKEISEGQTVTSGFQTPTLFKIAKDLKAMQIETSVSEADISYIKEDQEVKFTVDAYPNQDFFGEVNQIRLDPTSDSNVVTYTVIININNESLKLLPGMTAFVNVIIAKSENVLKVPNSAINLKLPQFFQENDKSNSVVYKINGKKITPIVVKKIMETEFEIAIEAEQLKEGDLIIQDVINKKQGQMKKNNRDGGPPF